MAAVSTAAQSEPKSVAEFDRISGKLQKGAPAISRQPPPCSSKHQLLVLGQQIHALEERGRWTHKAVDEELWKPPGVFLEREIPLAASAVTRVAQMSSPRAVRCVVPGSSRNSETAEAHAFTEKSQRRKCANASVRWTSAAKGE